MLLKSPWQLKLDSLVTLNIPTWVMFLLGKDNSLPLDDLEKERMAQFAVILMERIWMERNQIWKGHPPAHWEDLSNSIDKSFHKYWQSSNDRLQRRRVQHPRPMHFRWQPPVRGTLKFNFDATYTNGIAVTGVVLRNHDGLILGAWVNRFVSVNSYCAETEAAIQALEIANHQGFDLVEFEGDALEVIMALLGLPQFEDWRAMANILTGRRLISHHTHWTVKHIYREANTCAHNLAKWATSTSLIGSLDVTTLPPAVWCDRGGT